MMKTGKPKPVITAENRPFWDAVARHELRLQCCVQCGYIRPVPEDLCPRCLCEDAEWTQMSGAGRLSSWVVFHRAFHPAFEADLPYAIAQVDLDENVRFIGPLKTSPGVSFSIGQRVRVVFQDFDDGTCLPAVEIIPSGTTT